MGFRSLFRIGESWRVPLVTLRLRMARLLRAVRRWSFRYLRRFFRFFSFLTLSQVS
jgi:hypothetical protein